MRHHTTRHLRTSRLGAARSRDTTTYGWSADVGPTIAQAQGGRQTLLVHLPAIHGEPMPGALGYFATFATGDSRDSGWSFGETMEEMTS